MNPGNLTPKEQDDLFALLKKSGQQPVSGGMDQSVPDPGAQQLFGNQQSEVPATQPQPQTPLQPQTGDKMHPEEAMKAIVQHLSGPQLTQGGNGTYQVAIPSENPLFRMLGVKTKSTLEPTNYYDLFSKQAPNTDLSSMNLPVTPDGKPFMPASIYSELVKAKSLLPSSNNPSIDKERFMALHLGDEKQANEIFGDDPKKTVPLNELRLGQQANIATTRKGMLELGRNKFEQGQINDLINSISDAKQTNATPLGQQANKLNNVIHARQLLTGAYNADTGEYDISKAASSEVIMGVARAISQNGQLTDRTQEELSSPNAYARMKALLQFWTGAPVNANPQAITAMYRDMLDRQGAISQDLFNASAAREIPKGILLKSSNPLAYAAVMQNSFGTHDYRAMVTNGPDGAVSKLPEPADLGGRGTPPPPVPQQTPPVVPQPVQAPVAPPVVSAPKAAAKPSKPSAPKKSLPGMVIH